MEQRPAVEEDDLIILKHALWTQPEQRQDIGRIAAKLANPLNARAVELLDQAQEVFKIAMDAQAGQADDQAKMQAAVEAATKLKSIGTQIKKVHEQATSQGRSPRASPRLNSKSLRCVARSRSSCCEVQYGTYGHIRDCRR